MMHLYGLNASTCTRRVLFVAAELDLLDQIEYHKVDLFKGEHKDPAYIKDKQPFGQVPYFEDPDEGVQVYESRAIGRYLATKAGPNHLVPHHSDQFYLSKLAKIEQALSLEYTSYDPYASELIAKAFFAPMMPGSGGKIDQDKVDQLRMLLSAKLDVYDTILGKQKYLAGEEYSLADCFHLPQLVFWDRIGQIDMVNERPNVKRWWKEISQRPATKLVLEKYQMEV